MSSTKTIDLVLPRVEIISFFGQHVVAMTVNGKIISQSKRFADIAAAEAFAKAVINKSEVEIISFFGQHVVAVTVNGKIISYSKPFTDVAAAEAFAKAVISKSVESGGSLKPDQPTWN
jgi:sulfur carrier protein ThiS